MKSAQITRIVSLGLLLATAAPSVGHAQADQCAAPDDVAGTISALPAVASVLKAGSTLKILAVGSATMFGPEATLTPGTLTSQALTRPNAPSVIPPPQQLNSTGADTAFPFQMASALRAAVPGLKVEVVLRGGRGLPAADMLAIIQKELAITPFQLVLWQTGTVEAVRNSPPGEFAQILSNGAEAVDAAHANLVLIDPQYSRFLQTNSNLDPYTQALQQTASMPGVILFHRYDLMHAWVNDGRMDLERTPKNDRVKTVELLHRCLGAQLARLVLSGARS